MVTWTHVGNNLQGRVKVFICMICVTQLVILVVQSKNRNGCTNGQIFIVENKYRIVLPNDFNKVDYITFAANYVSR